MGIGCNEQVPILKKDVLMLSRFDSSLFSNEKLTLGPSIPKCNN